MVRVVWRKMLLAENRDSHEAYAIEDAAKKKCFIEHVKLFINGQSVDRMDDTMTLDNCRYDEFRLFENLGKKLNSYVCL